MNTPFLKYIQERLVIAPTLLESMVATLSEDDMDLNEGDGTMTIRDILIHLIYMEQTFWMMEIENILKRNGTLEPIPWKGLDHTTAMGNFNGKKLVRIFQENRTENLELLHGINIKKRHLNRLGIDPELGKITLKEVLSAWTAHDLSHVYQILRCLCYQFRLDVGPLKKHIKILYQNY
ncbi:MAG: DinB family protein [Muricauda sp. TMED12]|nr:MAG: DinB family protein [Muricauda sp. TMED12]|tara:strand:+ start:128393 stop:128926 length:534 start_codon:yes stop_codon:yes gene_type:complete